MAAKKTRRTKSSHPGVVLERQRDSWRARYVDPLTGKRTKVTLEARLSTREARAQWCKDLSANLATRRADIAKGVVLVAPVERVTIDAALATYLADAGVRLRGKTLATYALSYGVLASWAKGEHVTHCDELTGPKVASLRDAVVRQRKRTAASGERSGAYKVTVETRSPRTINRDLTVLGTLLTAWRRRGLVALSGDQIADMTRHVPSNRDLPVYLPPADLRRLLDAALQHDAETFAMTRAEHHAAGKPGPLAGSTLRYPEIAPFAAFLLLTGCRHGEALSLRWCDVDLEALDADGMKVGELRLRAPDVKTRTARIVDLEVTPALRRILAAMKLRAGNAACVFHGLTAASATKARGRLVKRYGAPTFTWKDLRSTCETYLANAPGIYGGASVFLAAKQLGHSVVVAEKKYAGTMRGISREARSLDVAMQIAPQLERVSAAVGVVRDVGRAPAGRRRAGGER